MVENDETPTLNSLKAVEVNTSRPPYDQKKHSAVHLFFFKLRF